MNQLKKRIAAAYSQKTTKLAVAGTMLMMSASSFAEGDPAAAAFTAMQTKVTTYEGYAWTMVIAVTGAVIGIKLFKKFANKAT